MEFPTERVNTVALALLERLEQAVKELDAVVETRREKVKTENGEVVTESEQKLSRKKGTVDRGGLKQLTGVLKDLEEILWCMPELDAREQQVRISRLERELTPENQEIKVILEGEVEEFAL